MVGIGFEVKRFVTKRPTFVKERAIPSGIALFFMSFWDDPFIKRSKTCLLCSKSVTLRYII